MPSIPNNAPVPLLRDVMDAVLQVYPHLTKADFLSPARRRAIARPKQVAMALSRELSAASYPQIGRYYGGRDHTTVIHAVKRIASLCEQDANLAFIVGHLRRRIFEVIAPEDGPRRNARERIRQAVTADPALFALIDPSKLQTGETA